jgi:Cu/Ag efflux protein CusF
VNVILKKHHRSGWLALALIPTLEMAVCSRAHTGTEPAREVNVSSPAPTVETKTYQGVGVVKSLNPKQPSIEIDHEAIKDLMPAMQMSFYVKDKSLLQDLKPGDRIAFTLENGVGGLKITEIRKR